MPDGRLAILWHLHQPDYRDPDTGVPVMPWVRMHSLRGYRDLAVESRDDGVPVTLNIVPSLLDQILYYAEGGTDRHLTLTERPADSLAAWRGKAGLAGSEIDPQIQRELLDELERWAIGNLGELALERPTVERYVLTAMRLPSQ